MKRNIINYTRIYHVIVWGGNRERSQVGVGIIINQKQSKYIYTCDVKTIKRLITVILNLYQEKIK